MIGKKILTKLIVIALAITIIIPMNLRPAAAAEDVLDIKAKAAILVDADSGKILYEKNSKAPLPIASMSKMMTEYLVNEAIKNGKISWDEKVTVSDYAHKISQNTGLSNVPLELGGQYTVRELYEAAAIYSANGATIALAEKIGGSEKNFVQLMNDKAKKLGLGDVKFVNATGLVNKDLQGMQPEGTALTDENIMSANGVAKLAYNLIKTYPEVLQTSSIPKKTFQEGGKYPVKMDNWNWMLPGLVFQYPGMDGLKTGSTDSAGFCFAGTAKRDGQRYITVVMGANSYNSRFSETAKLMDYGFSNFEKVTLVSKGQTIKGNKIVKVVKGKDKEVKVVAKDDVTLAIKRGEAKNYKATVQLSGKSIDKDGNIKAPIKKGTKVGQIVVKSSKNEDLGFINTNNQSYDLVVDKSVDKANWLVLSFRGIGSFFGNLWDSIISGIGGLFK
ncbi:serine hydrolase [Bacillus sp. AFS001701]|uniref:serine hydrolase n=1 Tax=Bacillus sp. AFS001701 TaxID=2033480 RepID=UPI002570054B|nr:serine hydrolase [Bacillus sp. AFS001701]